MIESLPKLLTVDQAAEVAQVHRATIVRLIEAGKLRASNFGLGKRAEWRIDPADLMTVQPAQAPAPRPERHQRRRNRVALGDPASLMWPPPPTSKVA